MTQADYDLLFAEYIMVCNKALEQNSGKFPFKQILDSIQERDKMEIVDVQILDDYFTPRYRLKIEKNKVTAAPQCRTKQNGSCCGGCHNRQWHVHASYLRDVTANAETYINNPALIDWEWLHEAA